MLINDSEILIESEYRAGKQERLRHIVEQPRGHVVDMDHLIGNECDTAHDEQHRTYVLRDFEAFVFHGLHRSAACCTENQGDDVTDRLKNRLYCLVHNCNVLNGLKIRVNNVFLILCKVTKNIRDRQIFRPLFRYTVGRLLFAATMEIFLWLTFINGGVKIVLSFLYLCGQKNN